MVFLLDGDDLGPVLPGHFFRVVPRAIVYHDGLQIVVVLAKNAVDGFRQVDGNFYEGMTTETLASVEVPHPVFVAKHRVSCAITSVTSLRSGFSVKFAQKIISCPNCKLLQF